MTRIAGSQGRSVPPGDDLRPSVALDGWRLDAARNRLVRGEREIRLEPRVMQTLMALLEHAGQPVRREELIRAVWGHDHVTDDALNRCVARLRRAFRKMERAPVIETLPRVGYQLHPVSDAPRSRIRRWMLPTLAGRAGLAATAAVVIVIAMIIGIGIGALREAAQPGWARDAAPVPVTTLGGAEYDAAWAPDSSRLVFAHRAEGSRTRLRVRQTGSDVSVPITDGRRDAVAPAWSPDGRHIAYLAFDADGCRVMLIEAAGGSERELSPCHPRSDHSLAWVGSGRSVVYTPPGAGPRVLARLDLDAGTTAVLTSPGPDEIGDAEPSVSPDHRRLAFTRWRDYGVGDLYLLDLDSGRERRLTRDSVKVHGSSWDGSDRILFASNRGGNFGLWSVAVTGVDAEPEPLLVGLREADGPAVSPDGGRLVFEDWSGRSEILKYYPARNAGETAISSSRWDWSPRLSPDGTRVAFVSDRAGAPEVWTARRDGSAPLRLTRHANAYVNDVAWAPDGAAVYYSAPVEGQFEIFRVSAAGGPARRLTMDPGSDRYPHVAADGVLYYGSRREGSWRIRRLQPGGVASDTTVPGSVARTDASGTALYVADCETGSLRRYRLPGLTEPEPIASLAPLDCAAWTLAGTALVAVLRDADHRTALARIDLSTGETETLTILPDLKYGTLLDADDDGIWYTSLSDREADLLQIGRSTGNSP